MYNTGPDGFCSAISSALAVVKNSIYTTFFDGKGKGLKYQGIGKKAAEKGGTQRDVIMDEAIEKGESGREFNGERANSSGRTKNPTLKVIWSADQKKEEIEKYIKGDVRAGGKEGAKKEDNSRDDLYPVLKKEVETWECEIKRIEEATTRARSKDRKESLEIQMANAQVMLKQALIQLSKMDYLQRAEGAEDVVMVENKEGKIVSVKYMVSGSNQDSKEIDGRDNKGLTTDNYSCSKEQDEVGHVDNKDDIKIDDQSKENSAVMHKHEEDMNWADMSDDNTVNLQNLQDTDNASGSWKTVEKNKRNKAKSNVDGNSDNTEVDMEGPKKYNSIQNPYGNKKDGNLWAKSKQGNAGKSTLTSYLETVKGKQRTPNKNEIRVTTAFTPRTAGTGDYYIRVAQEILRYAQEFDAEILLLPWDSNTKLGPISVDDLANPNAMYDVIKYYFDKPPYANWMPGVPIYGIGVRFSTNIENMNLWISGTFRRDNTRMRKGQHLPLIWLQLRNLTKHLSLGSLSDLLKIKTIQCLTKNYRKTPVSKELRSVFKT